MIITDEVVNKSRLVQAKSNRVIASIEGNNFNESPDYEIFDLIKQYNRIHFSVEGKSIDALPDHILVSILSLLDSKEAAKTSILAHRWRNLWTFTSRLVFDDSMLVSAMLEGEVNKSLEAERSRFINWVNNALKFHQRTTIDEFRVSFDVDERSCKPDIDGWITFAFEKRVQCLHLDFTSSWAYNIPWGSYTLTTQFLSNNYSINSLRILRLIAVEVTGEVLEYILSTCPLLEVLSIGNSSSLVRLKVSGGGSLRLKSLELLRCFSLNYIEISAPNLMSCTYHGNGVIAVANEIPRLTQASISGRYAPYIIKHIRQFSGVLSQLETLLLDLTVEVFRSFPKIPKMKNLRHLQLYLDGERARSLLYCAKLVKAFPMLRRFTLTVTDLAELKIYRKVKEKEPKKPYRCLKLIEFRGFVGCVVDIELLLCLLKGALSLKKLVIDPSYEYYSFRERVECEDPELLLATRSRAKQLETRLPPGAELVVL